MRLFNQFLFLSLVLLTSSVLFANEAEYVKGQILVQMRPDKNINHLVHDLAFIDGQASGAYLIKEVSKPMYVWLIGFDENLISDKDFLNAAILHDDVSIAQFNHYIQHRATTPNDPDFNNQWQYVNTGQGGGTAGADIDADLAWDITTGGVTSLGDTIVVCIVDDGIDTDHTDFEDNLWVNHAEIPNNNIDDDGNGYDDDYLGWNSDNNTDDITDGGFGGWHGTPVAGIVGAKGDNGIGVTGVNWNVKLMVVVGGPAEAEAIAAYTYPFIMRKRYNESNGADGAFVVATNSSWGIDGAQASSAPLWCAFYDTLGSVGILSAGATINGNQNVDTYGDLPTACPSDYLISVTNTTNQDVKETQAGYGLTTIDLGAPGSGTYTPQDGGGYGGFGGTSGATPHVAGTIGLLYSVPCNSFAITAKASPAAAALAAKNYILNGTDANASLDGITVTGGRLNMFGAVNQLLNNCSSGGCLTPFSLSASQLGMDSAVVSWIAGLGTNSFVLEYRETGGGSWTSVDSAVAPYTLKGLTPCTQYEFKVLSRCDADTSLFSDSLVFITDGCCDPPTGLQAGVSGSNGGSSAWDEVDIATSYNVRIRPEGGSWTVVNSTDNVEEFEGLLSCTEYELQVQTVCGNDSAAYSAGVFFKTGNCDCDESEYCESEGDDSSDEHIANVTLGSINNTSGNNGGYASFPNLSTQLFADSTYNIVLVPGWSGQKYTERFRVWIDWDRNGSFEDPTERVYTSGGVTDTVVADFTVPNSISTGTTGMRVSMKFQALPDVCEPASSFDYGEVEDYCVELIGKDVSINENKWMQNVSIFPNPFHEFTTISFQNPLQKRFTFELVDASGRLVKSGETSANTIQVENDNLPKGLYIFELVSPNNDVFRGKLLLN